MRKSASTSSERANDTGIPRWSRPWRQMWNRFLYSSSARNQQAPYIRDAASVQGMLNNLVLATLPCWLIGLWNIGHQSNRAMVEMALTELGGWRGGILSALGIGYDPASILACVMHGLLYFLPIFLVALLVGSLWDGVFALLRRRPLDEGLLVFAWLFALILPAGAPLYQVGLGMSFGMLLGKHVYGGTGRYLVNPALLGLIFLWLAYPNLVFGEGNWIPVPGYRPTLALELVALGGIDALLASGLSWWDLFIGARAGPLGMTSLLGSLLGAGYLVVTRSASWRVMLGVVLGVAVSASIVSMLIDDGSALAQLPWHWHILLGGFGFGAVFFATDPVAGAMTNAGRWGFGVLVGVLAIVLQVMNPTFSEAILIAILLASLCAPIIDYVVIESYKRRRQRRIAELNHG